MTSTALALRLLCSVFSLAIIHVGEFAVARQNYFAAARGVQILQQGSGRRVSDWQLKLVERWQVIEVVGRDVAVRQAENAQHQFATRKVAIGAVDALHEADGGLAAAEFVGQLALGETLFNPPLSEPHPIPPGIGARGVYCQHLYSMTTYKLMAGAEYKETQSNVLVMRPGNRLRELRKAKGLTQEQLAHETGVSQPAISQIENDVLAMDIAWMRAFARVLGCKPADLLDDNDNPDRLSAAERAILDRFRAADPAQRAILARMVDAVVPEDDADAVTAA